MTVFAFEASGGSHGSAVRTAPEPGHGGNDPLPEREWGLSAGQVVAIVIAIVAACELAGLLF